MSVRCLGRFSRRGVQTSACSFVKPTNVGDDGKNVDQSDLKGPEFENPFHRTGRILWNDLKGIKNFGPLKYMRTDEENWNLHKHRLRDNGAIELVDQTRREGYIFPNHVDVCIIGGGAIGSSIAYHITNKVHNSLRVAVVEKDSSVSSSIEQIC